MFRTVSLLVIVCLAAAAYFFWNNKAEVISLATAQRVPVVVETAEARDFTVYRHAVARAEASQSVEIRTQIDAQLMRLLVKDGQEVKAGDVLALLDDRAIRAELERLQAQKQVAQAQQELAQLELRRLTDLQSKKAVSQQELDQQQALLRQLTAQVQTVDAALKAQSVQLSHTQIKAPISGRIGMINIDAGNLVRTSDSAPIMLVAQWHPMNVVLALPQQLLPSVQQLLAQNESIDVNVFAVTEGPLLAQGTVTALDNRISRTQGTLSVKAQVNNESAKLWPDQSVVAAIAMQHYKNVLVISQRAIKQGADKHYVWRIKDEKAEAVDVQILHADSDYAIVEGIAAGDVLVVDGQYRLSQDSLVDMKMAKASAAP